MRATTDVWFIAFLMRKKIPIHKYNVITRGRVECEFCLTDDDWKRLKLEFNSSEIVEFKQLIEQIKDLAY